MVVCLGVKEVKRSRGGFREFGTIERYKEGKGEKKRKELGKRTWT